MVKRTPKLRWAQVRGYDSAVHAPKEPGDVGYDLEVAEEIRLRPAVDDEYQDIPCGVAVHIPDGFWGLIHPRSSALNKGIEVHTGVIDAGYRGPLYARVRNLTRHDIMVARGARVAQIILIEAYTPPLERVDILDGSKRGANGFGSTGGTV